MVIGQIEKVSHREDQPLRYELLISPRVAATTLRGDGADCQIITLQSAPRNTALTEGIPVQTPIQWTQAPP